MANKQSKTKVNAEGKRATEAAVSLKLAAAAAKPKAQSEARTNKPVADGKTRVRFLKKHIVDDERRGTPQEESYAEGDVVDFPDRSAQHFTSRQIAEVVVG